MKVLMLGRQGLLSNGGGDKIQIENTASELRKMGVEVDIVDSLNFDPSKYDVIHVFQLDWTPETYLYATKAKKYNKPIVLSPIHHSVSEVKKFDDNYVFDFRRISKILFKDQFKRDTFKNIYRSFFDPRRIKPTMYSILYGLENLERKTIQMSDILLVQTELEAADLKNTFKIDFKWKKVPNGVSENFLVDHIEHNELGLNDYIITVGRIEPRKNQLNIIDAVNDFRNKNNIDVGLVIIGSLSKRHPEYSFYFKEKLIKYPWIKHIQKVSYNKMPAYYKYAKVCVSASWFETTGLTSLEALFMGTNAVASGNRAKEYLNDLASYCEPDNRKSILDAIQREYFLPRPVVNDSIKKEYTWKNAAEKTLEVYNNLL